MSSRPVDFTALIVRLGWAAAVPLAAGLAGDLTAGLAWAIGGWVALTMLLLALPIGRWRVGSLAADLAFVVAALELTGPTASPLWWCLPVLAFVTALQYGWPAALLLPSGALLGALGAGYLLDLIEAGQLGQLGRELLAVTIAVPLAAWLAIVLNRRWRPSGQSAAPEDEADALAASMLGLSAELNATLTLDRIPQLLADLTEEAFNGGSGQLRSALLLRQEHGFQLASGDREHATVLPGESGLLNEAVQMAGSRLLASVAEDPELGQLGIAQGGQAAACVPLMVNGATHGALVLTHPSATYFTPQRMALLDAIAAQASIALHNAQLFRGLEQERDRITETEEETRRKLARDLHDGPTQTIAAIAMRLDFARRLVSRDQQAAEEEIQTLEEIARQTTREIRHMLFTLRPLILESKGLVAALRQLANKMDETHAQRVEVKADPKVADGLDMSKQAVIFFIAEEAINNAHKHAEAANIWVELSRAEGHILLKVQDDGVGFNVGAVDSNYEQRGSLGMVNMRERSELVSGALHIESSEGQGTQITLEVPLDEPVSIA